MTIPRPSVEQVSKCYEHWQKLKDYPKYEYFLKQLFTEIYPKNVDTGEVLIKVKVLDSLYNTRIRESVNAITLAEHIADLEIDQRIKKSDFTLVSEIASIRGKNLFSFATKYCSLHFQDDYPIYDSNVSDMLEYFNKRDEFANFTTYGRGANRLNQHPKFYEVMKKFQKHYGLDAFTLREIEKYLWYAAKSNTAAY